jgi:CHAP domain
MGNAITDAIGNAAAYVWGNCTYFVAKTFSWIPSGLGNAKDWLSNAQKKGLPTSSTPHPGDVVVYGAGKGGTDYGTLGHVAIVKSITDANHFVVQEMNARGLGIISERVSSMYDVLGFIRNPANAAAAGATGIGSAVGGAASTGAAVVTDIPGALAQVAQSVASFPQTVLDSITKALGGDLKQFGIRLALVLIGLVLLILGVRMLLGDMDKGESSPAPNINAPTRAEPEEAEAAEVAA